MRNPTRKEATVLYWGLLFVASLMAVLIGIAYDVPIVLPGLAVIAAGCAGVTSDYRYSAPPELQVQNTVVYHARCRCGHSLFAHEPENRCRVCDAVDGTVCAYEPDETHDIAAEVRAHLTRARRLGL